MNRIAELRKEKGWNQKDLADELNVHQTAVSQWETGKTNPDFELLNSICSIFDVSFGYLFGRSDIRGHFHLTDAEIEVLGNMEAEELMQSEQQYLLLKYSVLNETGKNEARKRIDELTRLTEYTKSED